ncbi:MAG TPA: hypothetical protein VKT76_11290 [Bradyrhizobium sp.]|nr:hypothetical protein [Bradyrhizobium sp.]
MIAEFFAYPSLVFLAVTLSAKLIERRGDVLYGPYIAGRKTTLACARDRIEAVMASLGPRRDYGRVALKFAAVGLFASSIIG